MSDYHMLCDAKAISVYSLTLLYHQHAKRTCKELGHDLNKSVSAAEPQCLSQQEPQPGKRGKEAS
jgi:hypothetical protein